MPFLQLRWEFLIFDFEGMHALSPVWSVRRCRPQSEPPPPFSPRPKPQIPILLAVNDYKYSFGDVV